MTYDQWFRSQQGLPYAGQYLFAEAAWTYQLSRIINMQDEIKKLAAERDTLKDALELIATPRRPDGTYNRCREACEIIAREALGY